MSSGKSRQAEDIAHWAVPVALVASVLCVVSLLFWLAGQLSSVLTGNGWPDSSPGDIFSILTRLTESPGEPARAWPSNATAAVGPAWLVFLIFVAFLVGLGFLLRRVVRLALNIRRRREFRRFRLGFASEREVRRLLSKESVLKKAASVRPSTRGRKNVNPREVGFFLGRDIRSRHELYASVEDVFIVLAPPRQGKDVHFCAPFTIDAPGPCIVTSTRADAFTNTYAQRAKVGKIYVFDPNDLTFWPEKLRWSPIRGCDNPLIAANRAAAMVSGVGLETSSNDAFWIIGATTILRCLLHAAALGGKTIRDVERWISQQTSPEPFAIMRRAEADGRGAPGWAGTLESTTIAMHERARTTFFSVTAQALNCFADPGVMDACSPGPDEMFDLREFLSGRNTLYILGKEKKSGSIAPVVTAMMEDLFDETRRIASRCPGSRLDPPLTVELNEAAHIAPLPNLPGYMGDSGGFSIALHVYLQSLSQARAKWGENEAMIMWDNAAVRVIMGGAGNVNDLEDISRLIGEFEERRRTKTRGDTSTVSTNKERRRVLSAEEVRTLEFGTALVVSRAARPVEAKLTPWWQRNDGKEIAAGKAQTEKLILQYAEAADRAALEATEAAAARAAAEAVGAGGSQFKPGITAPAVKALPPTLRGAAVTATGKPGGPSGVPVPRFTPPRSALAGWPTTLNMPSNAPSAQPPGPGTVPEAPPPGRPPWDEEDGRSDGSG